MVYFFSSCTSWSNKRHYMFLQTSCTFRWLRLQPCGHCCCPGCGRPSEANTAVPPQRPPPVENHPSAQLLGFFFGFPAMLRSG